MKKPVLQIIERYSGKIKIDEILIGDFLIKKSPTNNDLPIFIESYRKGEDSVYGKYNRI